MVIINIYVIVYVVTHLLFFVYIYYTLLKTSQFFLNIKNAIKNFSLSFFYLHYRYLYNFCYYQKHTIFHALCNILQAKFSLFFVTIQPTLDTFNFFSNLPRNKSRKIRFKKILNLKPLPQSLLAHRHKVTRFHITVYVRDHHVEHCEKREGTPHF